MSCKRTNAVLAVLAVLAALSPLALAGCARNGTGVGTRGPAGPSAGRSGGVLTVTSDTFKDGGRIPDAYASTRAGGENRSIPIAWSGAPEGTQSFALAIVDHAPVARMWVHWVVVDIPREATSIPEGASGTPRMPPGSRELRNTAGNLGYGGPNPPAGSGDHPYVVTVYALSVPRLDMPETPTAADIDRTLAGKVLAQASITGIYSK
jgi:Raf kinase inhibitor-like YbhB/YbcL family protein